MYIAMEDGGIKKDIVLMQYQKVGVFFTNAHAVMGMVSMGCIVNSIARWWEITNDKHNLRCTLVCCGNGRE